MSIISLDLLEELNRAISKGNLEIIRYLTSKNIDAVNDNIVTLLSKALDAETVHLTVVDYFLSRSLLSPYDVAQLLPHFMRCEYITGFVKAYELNRGLISLESDYQMFDQACQSERQAFICFLRSSNGSAKTLYQCVKFNLTHATKYLLKLDDAVVKQDYHAAFMHAATTDKKELFQLMLPFMTRETLQAAFLHAVETDAVGVAQILLDCDSVFCCTAAAVQKALAHNRGEILCLVLDNITHEWINFMIASGYVDICHWLSCDCPLALTFMKQLDIDHIDWKCNAQRKQHMLTFLKEQRYVPPTPQREILNRITKLQNQIKALAAEMDDLAELVAKTISDSR